MTAYRTPQNKLFLLNNLIHEKPSLVKLDICVFLAARCQLITRISRCGKKRNERGRYVCTSRCMSSTIQARITTFAISLSCVPLTSDLNWWDSSWSLLVKCFYNVNKRDHSQWMHPHSCCTKTHASFGFRHTTCTIENFSDTHCISAEETGKGGWVFLDVNLYRKYMRQGCLIIFNNNGWLLFTKTM